MNARTGWMRAVPILAVGAIGLALTVKANSQVQTTKEEQVVGAATRQVSVEHAEVLAVEGNHVILRMENGTIRDVANVPANERV
ncbi:MAG TPA: hypothetical protein VE195_01175, partial [Acidobacteriaceae bacterium]|nr:hypothetical protein [Acidobacteriaceae bacterium]